MQPGRGRGDGAPSPRIDGLVFLAVALILGPRARDVGWQRDVADGMQRLV